MTIDHTHVCVYKYVDTGTLHSVIGAGSETQMIVLHDRAFAYVTENQLSWRPTIIEIKDYRRHYEDKENNE